MSTRPAPRREKQHGIVYTPTSLANSVASRLMTELQWCESRPIVVADPACGDGALLEAFALAASQRGVPFQLVGYDLDAAAASRAAKRLSRWPESDVVIGDFLAGRTRKLDLFDDRNGGIAADLFIANPPYVRTQVLGSEQARKLAERFDIRGRMDLAYAFCMAMVDALPVGGLFAFIVSNKFMTIKAGASLRDFLEANAEIIELWDLGDTRLFSAAVLPAVVFGRRRPGGFREGVPYRSIYTSTAQASSSPAVCQDEVALLHHFAGAKSGLVSYGSSNLEIRTGELHVKANDRTWVLQDATVRGIQRKMRSTRAFHFSDVVKTKVGVKTTADGIFIRNDWDELPPERRPESEMLWPIRLASDAQRWIATAPRSLEYRILYPFERGPGRRKAINLDEFPRTRAYFESHKEVLQGRTYVTESGRQWFEPWVAHQPSMWSTVRAVFPEIAPLPLFALDHAGVVPNGTLFWMQALAAGEDRILHAAIAIANTRFVVEYYDLLLGTKLYASRRRWNSQHVGGLPFPSNDTDVERFAALFDSALEAGHAADTQTIQLVEKDADRMCRNLFGNGVV